MILWLLYLVVGFIVSLPLAVWMYRDDSKTGDISDYIIPSMILMFGLIVWPLILFLSCCMWIVKKADKVLP